MAGLAVTVLVHAALVLGWQMSRTLPSVQPEAPRDGMQWLHLPALPPPLPLPTEAAPPVPVERTRERTRAAPARAAQPAMTAVPAAPAPAAVPAPIAQEAATPPEAPAASGAAAIMENARRSVGSIDRALRKESKPTIIAPPDSPQIRMQQGMELAHSLAAPRAWQAPKVEELVNNTGDGARRTRVITGGGTYCITERSPATSIDMIEKHGKQRITSCPKDETPAKAQVWRTARD